MSLTDTAIRKAKPALKPTKMADGGGLYLLLRPDGARWWRWDYRRPVTGKRNTLSLGTYPDTGLAAARARHQEARRLLSTGIDPGEHRKAEKSASAEHAANTFGAVAEELLSMRAKHLHPRTAARERRFLMDDLAAIGDNPIGNIAAPALLAVLRKMEARGAVESAHRALAAAGMVFRYAIRTGKAKGNPAVDLKGALLVPESRHFASVTEPAKIGPLLRAIWGYDGSLTVVSALKLAPLFFVRPGELRSARWADIDLESCEWRFTTSKTDTSHVVPLATQAVEILQDLKPLSGRSEYVFPSERGRDRYISNNTLNAAIRRLGYGTDDMTAHGFRAMARTVLDEVLGFRPDFIEHQLAHQVRDPNGRAYNRTAHLPERRRMMQVWADYLDNLRLS